GTSHPIVIHPAREAGIDPALQNQVFQQASYGIVGERRHNSSVEAKTAAQAARDVVFATAFRNPKAAGRPNPPIPGIEAQHDFAQTDEIPAALRLFSDV